MFLIRKSTSLVDLSYKCPIDVWAVFTELDRSTSPMNRSVFWRLLKPGFRHVEIWKKLPQYGWLRIDTSVEAALPQFFDNPPWIQMRHLTPTCIRVQREVPNHRCRDLFFIGPITCVELSKAFLGVASMFVRTPYQLYNFLRT